MSDSFESIRVFILAENRLLREALTRILNKKTFIEVVGSSEFSPTVVGQITGSSAHVLISDSTAVALSELRLIPELRAVVPDLKVMMVGMENSPEVFLRAVRDGIVGYVLKEASAMEVVAAVRSVADNEAVCPPRLCLSLFELLAKQSSLPEPGLARRNLGLTRREAQLVPLIEHGLTNKQIASQLNLSEQTVKNHVHRILRKLGASDRWRAVELCRPRASA